MISNTENSYGKISKFLHWLMAIMLLCIFTVGYWLEDIGMPIFYKAHKAMGFLILILVVARLLWRFSNKVPNYEVLSMPKWMIMTAHMAHYTLYAFMIIVPLSAFIASNAAQYPVSFLFLFDMPSLFDNKNIELAKNLMWVHIWGAFIFGWLIGAHILAALYHHFIKKDNILIRMLPSCLHNFAIRLVQVFSRAINKYL